LFLCSRKVITHNWPPLFVPLCIEDDFVNAIFNQLHALGSRFLKVMQQSQ